MKASPIIVEETLKAPVNKVWKVLTDIHEMEQWYFEIDEFEPEVGFVFTFYGGSEEEKYLHICKIKEIIPNARLSYSWQYEGLDGSSLVIFDLTQSGNDTLLRLTHEGVETFPQNKPDFRRNSFEKGWNDIIRIYLKEYVESK